MIFGLFDGASNQALGHYRSCALMGITACRNRTGIRDFEKLRRGAKLGVASIPSVANEPRALGPSYSPCSLPASEFLDTSSKDVTNVNRAVLPDRDVMPPEQLTIVIAK